MWRFRAKKHEAQKAMMFREGRDKDGACKVGGILLAPGHSCGKEEVGESGRAEGQTDGTERRLRLCAIAKEKLLSLAQCEPGPN